MVIKIKVVYLHCQTTTTGRLPRTIKSNMKLDDLDIKIKNELLEQRKELCSKWKQNSAYDICFTNTDGTRYFKAKRVVLSWNDDKGHYMPFGGGTYWQIRYGKIKWATEKNPIGGTVYVWVQSRETFSKSANGTVIPNEVKTKKEVLEIAKQIGTLVM